MVVKTGVTVEDRAYHYSIEALDSGSFAVQIRRHQVMVNPDGSLSTGIDGAARVVPGSERVIEKTVTDADADAKKALKALDGLADAWAV